MHKRIFNVGVDAIIESIIVLVGGSVLAYLVKTQSAWAEPALYGVVGSACIALLFLAIALLRRLPKPKLPDVTVENIEGTARMWLDARRMQVQKIVLENWFFVTKVKVMDREMLVGRQKAMPGFLTCMARIYATPEVQRRLSALAPYDQEAIVSQVRMELSRTKTTYRGVVAPLANIIVYRHVPINDALTEHTFFQLLDDIDFAQILVQEIVRHGIGMPALEEEPKQISQ